MESSAERVSRCGGPLNGLDDAVRLPGQSADRMRGRETCIVERFTAGERSDLQYPINVSFSIFFKKMNQDIFLFM